MIRNVYVFTYTYMPIATINEKTMNLVQSTEGLEEEKGCNHIKISEIEENKNTQMLLHIGLVAWSCDGGMTASTQI